MAGLPAIAAIGRQNTGDTGKQARMDMSTDAAWEDWGRRDPYFGVITNPKFRGSVISEPLRKEFFESGEAHVRHVMATIRQYVDPQFAPQTVLDFGCGVGRLLVAFSKLAQEVTGVDVSQSMLQEARLNCDESNLQNVILLPSDDSLSSLTRPFDLIHSCIVFQHIPVDRGRAIFEKLIQHLRPGGVGAVQLTYSKIGFAGSYGVAPAAVLSTPLIAPPVITPSVPANLDPEIQMNPYSINEILFLMQCRGIQRLHCEFTDHGGELGVFLFFQRPKG
jgi:SAM-dependent methyltransferase